MYIRKTTRVYKGKTYTNHLLVESVQTPQGPRQRTICSLGSLEPAPAEHWRGLAHKLDSALQGQQALPPVDSEIQPLSARPFPRPRKWLGLRPRPLSSSRTAFRGKRAARLARCMWVTRSGIKLGMNGILQRAG